MALVVKPRPSGANKVTVNPGEPLVQAALRDCAVAAFKATYPPTLSQGIPEGIDIWQPFQTTKPTGTGLGLMIVRQIIVKHHGAISYTSQRGKGTTFRLSFPLTLKPQV